MKLKEEEMQASMLDFQGRLLRRH